MSVLSDGDVACMTDLAEFLQSEVNRTSLRKVAGKTGVAKTTIENIVKGNLQGLPEIETLQAIATAYGMDLWLVAHMAGIDLGLPQTPTEAAQRLEVLVNQVPALHPLVERLQAMYLRDPEFVKGMLISLEAAIAHRENGLGIDGE